MLTILAAMQLSPPDVRGRDGRPFVIDACQLIIPVASISHLLPLRQGMQGKSRIAGEK
jgi:hypothetical protein